MGLLSYFLLCGHQGNHGRYVRGGVKAVIQCKLSSKPKPAGNVADQQIIAGRVCARADPAAVASPSPFTQSARQLAASAGVLLLLHSEIDVL